MVAKVGGVYILLCPVIDKLVKIYALMLTTTKLCDKPGQLSSMAVDLVGLVSC